MSKYLYFGNVFPSELRIAEAVFIFKKNDPNGKTNYQRISFPPVMSEIYGEVVWKNIWKSWLREYFVEKALSPNTLLFQENLFNLKCV